MDKTMRVIVGSSILAFAVAQTMACSVSPEGVVIMAGQGLTDISTSTFLSCKSNGYGDILKVDLSGNNITDVDPDTFKSLYNLEEIDLSHNEIEELDSNTFEGMRSLETLDLSYNRFQTLKTGILHKDLFALTEVSFVANNISEVEWDFVNENHEFLQLVDLKNNSLTTFDPWPYLVAWTGNTTKRDRVFDLQHNQITALTNRYNWTFDLQFPYEVEVYLQYNELSSLDPQTLRQYKPGLLDENLMPFFLTFYVNISNNPFFCDCNVYPFAKSLRDSFLRWRDVEDYRFRCAAPAKIQGEDWLHDIPYEYFVCNITTDCPTNCFCQERPHNNTFLIDCRGAGLTELPNFIPHSGAHDLELFFDDNMIQEVKNVTYLGMIYNISLNNNQIRNLESETIKLMTNVKQLDIRHNRIEDLPNSIQRLEYGTVQLAGNPLKCGCNSLWLSDWVKLDEENGDLSVQCEDDKGDFHRLIDLNLADMGCTNTYIIIASIIGAVVAVVVGIALIFAMRCPYETKVILYKVFRIHPKDKYKIDPDPEYIKDIYLSYDNEDIDVRQWIMDIFVEKLNHKKPFYSIMIPFIHFGAGEKHEQIDYWIRKSKRIVIVLSEKYFENEDCEMESMCAADEQNKNPDKFGQIIYILFNGKTNDLIQDKVQEEPWKTRLAGKILLSPDDKLFWSKLRYELPVKPAKQEPDDRIMSRGTRPKSPDEHNSPLRNGSLRQQLPLKDEHLRNLSPKEKKELANQYRKQPKEIVQLENKQGENSSQHEIINEVAARPKLETNTNGRYFSKLFRKGTQERIQPASRRKGETSSLHKIYSAIGTRVTRPKLKTNKNGKLLPKVFRKETQERVEPEDSSKGESSSQHEMPNELEEKHKPIVGDKGKNRTKVSSTFFGSGSMLKGSLRPNGLGEISVIEMPSRASESPESDDGNDSGRHIRVKDIFGTFE